jgi:threonine/homoserine/homoserine lactone efflux protein
VDASLVTYISLTALLAATPGATTAVVIGQTLAGGRRNGYIAAIGAAAGNATQAVAAGLGLAILLQQSPRILTAVQMAGTAYLLWLGLSALRRAFARRPRAFDDGRTRAGTPAFRQGLVTNLLNPAIITFYLVVVPAFVPPSSGAGRFVTLAAIHIALAFLCHLGWATLLDTVRTFLASPTVGRVLHGATGLALIWLALNSAGALGF